MKPPLGASKGISKVSFKIEAITSSVRDRTLPFPISREVMTTNRCMEAANRRRENNPVISATIESASHADTWCFGPNFVMDHFTGKTCSVSGYDEKIKSTEICIGTGLTMWTDPNSGKLQLLQDNQGLDIYATHFRSHSCQS